jgi:hypothetical protein
MLHGWRGRWWRIGVIIDPGLPECRCEEQAQREPVIRIAVIAAAISVAVGAIAVIGAVSIPAAVTAVPATAAVPASPAPSPTAVPATTVMLSD